MAMPIPLLPPVTIATLPSSSMVRLLVDGGAGRAGRIGYASWSMRWWPTRMALAMAVSAGFTAPMLGKKLVSTT